MNTTNSPGAMPGQQTATTPVGAAAQPAILAMLPANSQAHQVSSRPNGSFPVPLAYTVDEAAAALHVCPKTIRRLLDRGILTASKVLRKKLIPRSQIEGFLKATCDLPKSIN